MVNQMLSKKKSISYLLISNSAFSIELESTDKEINIQTPRASTICAHEKLELWLDK